MSCGFNVSAILLLCGTQFKMILGSKQLQEHVARVEDDTRSKFAQLRLALRSYEEIQLARIVASANAYQQTHRRDIERIDALNAAIAACETNPAPGIAKNALCVERYHLAGRNLSNNNLLGGFRFDDLNGVFLRDLPTLRVPRQYPLNFQLLCTNVEIDGTRVGVVQFGHRANCYTAVIMKFADKVFNIHFPVTIRYLADDNASVGIKQLTVDTFALSIPSRSDKFFVYRTSAATGLGEVVNPKLEIVQCAPLSWDNSLRVRTQHTAAVSTRAFGLRSGGQYVDAFEKKEDNTLKPVVMDLCSLSTTHDTFHTLWLDQNILYVSGTRGLYCCDVDKIHPATVLKTIQAPPFCCMRVVSKCLIGLTVDHTAIYQIEPSGFKDTVIFTALADPKEHIGMPKPVEPIEEEEEEASEKKNARKISANSSSRKSRALSVHISDDDDSDDSSSNSSSTSSLGDVAGL